ncbi:hypothetical protein [Lysobacter sp. ESA13C]|uniref:hypothetical protein n=1 Tax=Lysobacter sp. ESA13C TaxID=2862676 RepID=UPI001CBD84E7|nr:hypothetical protein [Lysobacter sp. ESA13C]
MDHPASRSPVWFPLALGACVFVLTAAFFLVAQIEHPLPEGADGAASQVYAWLEWLCGIGLLIGVNLALASALIARRGPPQRAWAALLVAVALVFGLGYLWSIAVMQSMQALSDSVSTVTLYRWVPPLNAVKVVVTSSIGLAIAFAVGGRGPTPVVWSGGQRRLIGALVAFGVCAGVLLLLQHSLSRFTALDDNAQRHGMTLAALGIGFLHGLCWALLPARRGAGAMPALISALLTPLLIVLSTLPLLLLGDKLGLAELLVIVLLLLFAAPVLASLLVVWLHRRRYPAAQA